MKRKQHVSTSMPPVSSIAPMEQQLAAWGVDHPRAILALSQKVSHGLSRFATRYPAMRHTRIPPLALSVAAAAPFSPEKALLSTAKISLWVFALDDLIDEELAPAAEILSRTRQYNRLILQGKVRASDDQLLGALAELLQDHASYPLFQSLDDSWREALVGTIDGMLVEQRWLQQFRRIGAAAFPSYQEYLANGRFSIGGPPHIWSTLVTIGDASTPWHLGHLRQMEELASTCIRLANDLQSHSRESADGKFNSFDILRQQFYDAGLSQTEAKSAAEARVRADIATGLERLSSLFGAACTASGLPELAITNIARLVCQFYGQHDFHTFRHGGGESA